MSALNTKLYIITRKNKEHCAVTAISLYRDSSAADLLNESIVIDTDLELCKKRVNSMKINNPESTADLIIREVDSIVLGQIVQDVYELRKEEHKSFFTKIKEFFKTAIYKFIEKVRT